MRGKRQQRNQTAWATARPFLATFIVVLVFVVSLFLFQNTATINPTSEGLLAFLVVVISYLIFSGRLAEIGGAGFVLRLRQVSRSNVSIEEISTLEVKDLIITPQIVGKSSLDYLKQNLVPRLPYGRITTLAIRKGLEVDRYTLYQYLAYLTTSPSFRDVIFVDSQDRFEGWIQPETLMKLLDFYENATPLIKAINEGRIADIPGVSTHFVSENTTNRDALRKMVRENVQLLAVLDNQSKFVGIVERASILASPLIRAIIESN